MDFDKAMDVVRRFGWKKATVIGLLALGAIVQCVDGQQHGPEAAPGGQNQPPRSSEPNATKPPAATPSPTAPSPPMDQAPTPPNQAQLQLDAEYHAEWTRDPSRDIDGIVAKKHGITKEELAEEQMTVALYRDWLRKQAEQTIRSGVVGGVEVQGLDRSELGVHTLKFTLTVTRCPEGAPERDKQIEFLATTALKQIVQNLPADIDSYQASIRYRGLGCGDGAVGYGAHWTRSAGALTLR